MAAGVYQITCLATGRFYIGSSVNVGARWRRHQLQLANQKHCNAKLQAAWNKYGQEYFELDMLEQVVGRGLKAAEERWFALKKPFFNINPRADAPMRDASPELRERMRAIQTGKKHTPETRARMSSDRTGKRHTEETRARLSALKSGQAPNRPGYRHSDETRAKIKAAHARRRAAKWA